MFKKIKQKTQHLSFNQKMVLFIVSFFVLIFILFILFLIFATLCVAGTQSKSNVSRDYHSFDLRYVIENKY